MTINLPERVAFLLECLNIAGYAAYVVGGCVRDSILGKTPHDWDICTSAKPEEIKNVFEQLGYDVIETGAKYGTVTVVMKNSWQPDEAFEITTFRIDGEYKDNRRPNDVQFTNDLVADLSRRDFTINAMAYHPTYGLIDPFGGLSDIKRGRICCVGDPDKRFEEDALRMLRAVRFALRFNYVIDFETQRSIERLETNIKNISIERASSEITRILTETFFPDKSNYDSAVWLFLRFLSLFDPFRNIYKYSADIITSLSFCDNSLETSLAFLCNHDEIEKMLLGLRFPKSVAKEAAEIRKIGLIIMNDTKLQHAEGKSFRCRVREIVSKVKSPYYRYVAEYSAYYAMANADPKLLPFLFRVKRQIMMIYDEDIPIRISDLSINGNDIMAFGYKGTEVSFILNHLLEKVMAEDLKNDHDVLLDYLKMNNHFLKVMAKMQS